ncbi:MAG: LysM peptidoglycan-binding domain-containing protein, partial [Oceanospirillum sp.]|nr:LysM peptidoglycan-binding domain-containing protein [Oceanospirillum sp.]
IRELARWNGMAPNDPLMPGKKLVIWSKAERTVSSNAKNRKIIRRVGYKVRQGDSLARIAGKFNVSVKQIVSWNKIDKRKYLQPGQSLTLYVDVTRSH